MYLVRELITKAFKSSTVRGLGETPDAEEVLDALETLNGFLDEFTAKPEFAPAKKFRDVNVEGNYFTISDTPSKVIVTALASPEGIVCTFASQHGLTETEDSEGLGGEIVLRIDGRRDYQTFIVEIIDQFTIKTNPILSLMGTFKGTAYKPGETMIDVVDVPPVNVYQVIDGNGNALPELQEQDFYANKDKSGKWFFYDKSRDPYARVWVGQPGKYTVVYEEPCWHDLDLDTDIESIPRDARSVIKWRLAADIAGENKYYDAEARCEKRYKNALMDFYRSKWNSASPLSDTSAPGFGSSRYNIREDA